MPILLLVIGESWSKLNRCFNARAMAEPKDELLINLPAGLQGQFSAFENRLWRVETAAAVGGLAASLLFSCLLIFVSDRVWDTPVWLRVLIFLAGLAGAAASALRWMRHWVWHRRDLRALATLVQKKYRRLGDRLLGIVELANEQKHSANFSPALYHAAIEQVAGEAQKFDFQQSVNPHDARRFGWMAGGLCGGLAVLCLALPQAGWNSFLRWLEPVGGIARHTLVALDGFPHELVVPHGEPFEISGSVRYLSFWKPAHVAARLGLQTKVQTAVQSNQIRLQIPGQLEKGVLEVRVGDALARVQIVPSHRPSLQELMAVVQLPAYLGYPDENIPVQNGSLQALEGSTLKFRGTVSRPLVSGHHARSPVDDAPLKVQGSGFVSESPAPASVGEFDFTWRDQLGLTNASPWRLSVLPQKDTAPQPDLPDLPRPFAMLASDVLHIHATAEDDYGVRDLGLNWEVVSDGPGGESLTTEAKIMAPSSKDKKLEKTFLWSPALYQIPTDSTVELQAYARDFFPERERARTAVHTIRVLSAEEHAEMLRQQLEGLMAQIEDVARLQEKIVSDARGVQEAGTNMPDAQQTSKLGQRARKTKMQNAAHLQDLTPIGERNLVREAMKNSNIPEDTVRQWSPDHAGLAEIVAGKNAAGRPVSASRLPKRPITAAGFHSSSPKGQQPSDSPRQQGTWPMP